MDTVKRSKETRMARFQDSMSEMFGRLFGEFGVGGGPGEGWFPPMDMAERDDAVVIKADLPGMTAEQIEISVQGNTLVVTGEKQEKTEEKEESYYHIERRVGTFRRVVALPSEVKADKVQAAYKDGVLTITLPKSEQAKAKKIPVRQE